VHAAAVFDAAIATFGSCFTWSMLIVFLIEDSVLPSVL